MSVFPRSDQLTGVYTVGGMQFPPEEISAPDGGANSYSMATESAEIEVNETHETSERNMYGTENFQQESSATFESQAGYSGYNG